MICSLFCGPPVFPGDIRKMANDVYISAAPDDYDSATLLCRFLEDRGIRCWNPNRDRSNKLRWFAIDEDAVLASRLLILIWSARELGRPARETVNREVELAKKCNIPILAIQVDGYEFNRQSKDVDVLTASKGLLDLDRDKLLASVQGILRQVPRTVRVLIFAPKGADAERQHIVSLLKHFSVKFGNRISFDVHFWQETGVIEPTDEDIFLAIQWNHLGTRFLAPSHREVWVRVGLENPRACEILIYLKKAELQAGLAWNQRIREFTEEATEFNLFIDNWICKPGQVFEVERTSVSGNPPPDFEADLLSFVQAGVNGTCDRARKGKRGKVVTLGFSGDGILIPDRFVEQHILYCEDPRSQPETTRPETTRSVLAKANFAAFAPPMVKPGSEFSLEVWACPSFESRYLAMLAIATREEKYQEIGKKISVPVELGTWLTVNVSIPKFGLRNAVDKMFWDGDIVNASFRVSVPSEAERGSCLGIATILGGWCTRGNASFWN
jgi:hypothetical protein